MLSRECFVQKCILQLFYKVIKLLKCQETCNNSIHIKYPFAHIILGSFLKFPRMLPQMMMSWIEQLWWCDLDDKTVLMTSWLPTTDWLYWAKHGTAAGLILSTFSDCTLHFEWNHCPLVVKTSRRRPAGMIKAYHFTNNWNIGNMDDSSLVKDIWKYAKKCVFWDCTLVLTIDTESLWMVLI